MNTLDFYAKALSVPREQLSQELADHTELIKVGKGTRLVSAGEIQERVAFLVSGIVRGYLLDVNGRDITDCFVFRTGEPVFAAFELGQKEGISVEALTDCELMCIPLEVAEELVARETEYALLYVRLMCTALRAHWEMKVVLYQQSAAERYQWFLNAYPGLIDQVKHKHIASFLGMSPVTLSRLRSVNRTEEQE